MLLLGCKENHTQRLNINEDVSKTKLEKYLFEDFSLPKKDQNLVIILSINACSGCTQSVVEKLKKITEINKNITVVSVAFTSKQAVNQVRGLDKINVVYDKTGRALNKESLYLTDNLAVIIENKKIKSNFYFNPSNRLDSILNLIDKYDDR